MMVMHSFTCGAKALQRFRAAMEGKLALIWVLRKK